MKNLNCKLELYLDYIYYNPLHLLDINYILHNIIEYNLVQVEMIILSIILKYMGIIKLKILNFLNFIQQSTMMHLLYNL